MVLIVVDDINGLRDSSDQSDGQMPIRVLKVNETATILVLELLVDPLMQRIGVDIFHLLLQKSLSLICLHFDLLEIPLDLLVVSLQLILVLEFHFVLHQRAEQFLVGTEREVQVALLRGLTPQIELQMIHVHLNALQVPEDLVVVLPLLDVGEVLVLVVGKEVEEIVI